MPIKPKAVPEEFQFADPQPPPPNGQYVPREDYERLERETAEISDNMMAGRKGSMESSFMLICVALIAILRTVLFKMVEHNKHGAYTQDISMALGAAALVLLGKWIETAWKSLGWDITPSILIAVSALGIYATMLVQGESPVTGVWVVVLCLLFAASHYPRLGVHKLTEFLNGGRR